MGPLIFFVTRQNFNFFLGPSLNKSVDLHSTISDKGMHKIERGMPKNKIKLYSNFGRIFLVEYWTISKSDFRF